MDTDRFTTNELSGRIIGCAFRVPNTLGPGFLEKIYENALAHELRKSGLAFAQQHKIAVYYDGIVVGDYVIDLLVEGTVIVELKASKILESVETAQCINYMTATGLWLCLLLNFSKPRLGIRRIVHGL